MEQRLILLLAAFVVYLAQGVQGTSHLSFSSRNETFNITVDGCGATKICVKSPESCDPSGNENCTFTSVMSSLSMPPNGINLSIEIRGMTPGYVAMGLQTNLTGTTMLFICGHNSSSNATFFMTKERNNGNNTLTELEKAVNEIQVMETGEVIKCKFQVPMVNASKTRTGSDVDTTFSILLGTGNVVGDGIGDFNEVTRSNPMDLIMPSNTTTPTPTLTPTPTPTLTPVPTNTTTGSSGAVHPHALLVLLSVLSLSFLLNA